MLVNDEIITKLSAPCKPDDFCGVAMDYAPEFLALEQMLYVKPEQQYGEVVIPQGTVDWRAVRVASEELLRHTKDLRVSGYWSQAMVALYGLDGLRAALLLTLGLLKSYWNEIHPRLEVDDEFDPLLRSNALLVFSDPLGILMHLRRSELLTIKGITALVSDAEAVFSPSAGVMSSFDRHQLNLMISEAQSEQLYTISSSAIACRTANEINDFCKEQFGTEMAPDLSALLSLLSLINFPDASNDRVVLDDGMGGDKIPSANVNSLYNSGGNQSSISSRLEASKSISLICEYFESSEPASPVPLLLRRAQSMIGKNFIEIMKDISPDSLPRIEIIAGVSLVDH
jgi:type VI secretion system protein ImpA